MMNICWKYFVPVSFACIMGLLVYMPLAPWGSTQSLVVRFLMTGVLVAIKVAYFRRVFYHIRAAGDKIYIKAAV